MKLLLTILILLILIPLPIYFFVNDEYLQIYFVKIKWHDLTHKIQSSTQKNTKKPTFKSNYLKAIRIKKVYLTLGYQCEMIDESMYLYDFYLILSPTLVSILKQYKIQATIVNQYLPIKKSTFSCMIYVSLARLFLEMIRR